MLDDPVITGADELTRDLKALAERCDLRPFYDGPVTDFWRQRQAGVFADRLAPLSSASIRRKRVHKRDPMVATGMLKAATTRYTPVKATKDYAIYGIPKGNPYKWLGHMHANRHGSRPKRDVVPGLSRGERLKILDMLSDYLMRGL